MCGIAGIISLNGSPVYELSNRLNKMKKLLKHRGPDQSGSYVSDDCKIGIFNNRLSIVGIEDSLDLPLKKNAWYWKIINDPDFSNIYKILEFRNTNIKDIKKIFTFFKN